MLDSNQMEFEDVTDIHILTSNFTRHAVTRSSVVR